MGMQLEPLANKALQLKAAGVSASAIAEQLKLGDVDEVDKLLGSLAKGPRQVARKEVLQERAEMLWRQAWAEMNIARGEHDSIRWDRSMRNAVAVLNLQHRMEQEGEENFLRDQFLSLF